MTVDDRTRLNLHRKLATVLGQEEADTLMAHLPPISWQHVVTTTDIEASETRLRHHTHTGLTQLRGDMNTGFANIRGAMNTEFANLRGDMNTQFTAVRGEMRTRFASVRGDISAAGGEVQAEFTAVRGEMRTEFAAVRGEISTAVTSQTRSMTTFVCAWSAVAIAAARLLL